MNAEQANEQQWTKEFESGFFDTFQKVTPSFGDEDDDNPRKSLEYTDEQVRKMCEQAYPSAFRNRKLTEDDIVPLAEWYVAHGVSVKAVRTVALSYLYGSYGLDANPELAEVLAYAAQHTAFLREGSITGGDNRQEFAISQILLGTVKHRRGQTLDAARYFIRGLKTRQIILNRGYSSYIERVLEELEALPKEPYPGQGVGFDVENPAGGVANIRTGQMIAALTTGMLSLSRGKDDKLILYFRSPACEYGHLERLGSCGNSRGEIIDKHETYVYDNHKLYRAILYFNNYTRLPIEELRFPQDFD